MFQSRSTVFVEYAQHLYTLITEPPRFTLRCCRAWSTKTRLIIRAAT